jgi:hypothetical protein
VHAYELPPTATELTGWISVVEELIAARRQVDDG